MQEELEKLLEHIEQNKPYHAQATLAFKIRTADKTWPEAIDLDKDFAGRVTIDYLPSKTQEAHGQLTITNGKERFDNLVYASHSSAEQRIIAPVKGGDTLATKIIPASEAAREKATRYTPTEEQRLQYS